MRKKIFVAVAIASLTLGLGTLWRMLTRQHILSPYVDQTNSPVVGLSDQEVEDLLSGSGAGYARVAELNSYPGPRHVLDLKQPLNLSEAQEQQIQIAFDTMQAEAQRLGQLIVDQEQALSQAFATTAVEPDSLEQQTQDLATLYGQLRATHLQAHLAITPLLSSEQVEQYNLLRGYGQGGHSSSGHSHR